MISQSDAKNLTVRTTVRLPPGLRRALHASAAKNRRSINSELIVRLTRTYRAEPKAEASHE